MMRFVRAFPLLSLFFVSGVYAECGYSDYIVKEVLSRWRSSERFIPGNVLFQEAQLSIPSTFLLELSECTQDEIIGTLRRGIQNPAQEVDLGVAENLLKIQQLQKLARNLQPLYENFKEDPIHGRQDEINGLNQNQLNELLAGQGFPERVENNPKFPKSFSYKTFLITRMAIKWAIDNDLYAFTVAAILYGEGMHESSTAVFEHSSRGNDRYPFMVSMGQDQVVDMLENVHFTRWDIEVIRGKLSKILHVEPGFYEWLAKWRWRGDIRAVKAGTIIFKTEPFAQYIENPASEIIAESLVNPTFSTMTNFMTNAAQIILAANGTKVTESGTRRAVTGAWSAMTAVLAGAVGTSNLLMATLMNSTAYGTWNHASVGLWPSELEAVERMVPYSKNPTLWLPDTYNIQDGLRTAVMGAGDHIATFRQDSSVVDMDTQQNLPTEAGVKVLKEIFKNLRKGEWKPVLTNDLRKGDIALLAKAGLDVGMYSAGGAFLPDGHGNMVFKLVELRNNDTGKVFFPIKLASTGKGTEPGEKDLWRVYNLEGRLESGYKTRPGEGLPMDIMPGQKTEQIVDYIMRSGKRTSPRVLPATSVPYLQQQFSTLAPELLDPQATVSSLEAKGLNFKTYSSPALKQIRRDAIARVTPRSEHRVLVVLGSFNPVTATHIDLAVAANELYKNSANRHGFRKILFVPAGQNPVHKEPLLLSPAARVESLTRALRQMKKELPQAEVWMGEIEEGGSYTIDTLNRIQAENPEASIYAVMGTDTFWTMGSVARPWRKPEEILNHYNLVVLKRPGIEGLSQERSETEELLKKLGYEKRLNAFVKPEDIENPERRIQFHDPRQEQLSATKIREFYSAQAYHSLVHFTDPQWTFSFRSLYPKKDQTVNGGLAVKGTELTIDHIEALAESALKSRSKTSFSRDSHFEVERVKHELNGEFKHFPRHGMANDSGPEGDRYIVEVEELLKNRKTHVLPSNEEVDAPDGSGKTLRPVPFDLSSLGEALKNPEDILIFEKNGVGAHSVYSSPHFKPYIESLDPYKVLPHFHAGWCTDYCDYFPLMEELKAGYNVYFVIDAAAGVQPRLVGQRLRELLSLGLKLISTREFIELQNKWNVEKATWSTVVNDMADFDSVSRTSSLVAEALKDSKWKDPESGSFPPFGEAVFLEKDFNPSACEENLKLTGT